MAKNTHGPSQQLNEALACRSNGDPAGAARILKRMVNKYPDDAGLLSTYGCVLKEAGRFPEAVEVLQRAVELSPDVAAHWADLGAASQDSGDWTAAVRAYRQSIALDPARWGVYFNLGQLQATRGQYAEAEAFYRFAIKLKNDFAPAWTGLARICLRLARLEESVACFGEALALDPSSEVYCDLSLSLCMSNRWPEALAAARHAIRLDPGYAMGHYREGNILTKSRIAEGNRSFEAALAADPRCHHAMKGLGIAAIRSCDWENAVNWLVRAMELDPRDSTIHSALLFVLSISNLATPERVLEELRRWEQMHGPAAPAFQHTPDPAAAMRRIRIGFVSGDFWDHPVRFFITPILRALDRTRFEVVCYSNTFQPDGVTAEMRTLADRWYEVFGAGDEELAQRIKNDGIDILVDLSGHTDENRLLVFARKPAPVQLTYLGAPNGTGLAAMDYWLTDWVLHPPDTPQRTAERILRLPRCWMVYEPLASAPEVARREGAGPVTFGCFNNLGKLSPQVLRLWARILTAAPDSTLLIKVHGLSDAPEYLKDRLTKAGIDPARVTLMDKVPSREEHLSWYGAMDIALDTTPFSGATTTAEALWMGVPVVTLPGDLFVNRMSASMLHAAGLDKLIAEDEDDYVRIAAKLACDHVYRAQLRTGLRERVAASELCNGADFAEKAGTAFQEMWKHWCASPLVATEQGVTA